MLREHRREEMVFSRRVVKEDTGIDLIQEPWIKKLKIMGLFSSLKNQSSTNVKKMDGFLLFMYFNGKPKHQL